MAILFGTTADGESLPVQVNQLGQLVAQGLPGVQGPPGDPGPEGPTGTWDQAASWGYWTPSFISTTSGTALIEYETQQGGWYKSGGFLMLWFLLETKSVLFADARGALAIGGLPEPFASPPDFPMRQGAFNVGEWGGFKSQEVNPPTLRVIGDGDVIRLWRPTIPNKTSIPFTELDDQNPSFNRIGGTWLGVSESAMSSLPNPLDELV